jgi:hypothetical protein
MAHKEIEYVRRRMLELEARLVMVEEALQGRYARILYSIRANTSSVHHKSHEIPLLGCDRSLHLVEWKASCTTGGRERPITASEAASKPDGSAPADRSACNGHKAGDERWAAIHEAIRRFDRQETIRQKRIQQDPTRKVSS